MGFILALRTINYYFVREAAAGDSRSNVADLSKSELLIETACSLAKKKKKKRQLFADFLWILKRSFRSFAYSGVEEKM